MKGYRDLFAWLPCAITSLLLALLAAKLARLT